MSQRKKLPFDRTFDFLGAKINFRVLGSGLPIILIHGSMVYDPWGGFEKTLAKKYKVYWIDLPGFGGSEAVGEKLHNTDLFSKCVGEYIKSQDLGSAPIISLSLGTIVAAKVVADGYSKGKQLMVGTPGKLFGAQSRLACMVPVLIRRMIAGTDWGKKTLIIPMLRGNTGDKKGNDGRLLRSLQLTDPKSLADIDYLKEIEEDMPMVLRKIINKNVYFVYGQNDSQRNTIPFVENYYTIMEAGHSPFGSHPSELMKIVSEIEM